jgi:hypothetical protein
MDNDDDDVRNNQPPLGMQYESFHFIFSIFFHFAIKFLYLLCIVIYFHMPSFSNIDFCLQLVWTIVRRVCNIVYNFEREKTMLAT